MLSLDSIKTLRLDSPQVVLFISGLASLPEQTLGKKLIQIVSEMDPSSTVGDALSILLKDPRTVLNLLKQPADTEPGKQYLVCPQCGCIAELEFRS